MLTGEVVATSEELIRPVPYRYSIAVSEVICQRIREGMTLKKISSLEGMPDLHTLYAWRATFPDFKHKLDCAREDRADYYFDKVIDIAEETENVVDKDDVPSLKLSVDTYKWAAEKGAPKRYGAKVEVENKHSGKIGFYVLNTGIQRLTDSPSGDSIETTAQENHEPEPAN